MSAAQVGTTVSNGVTLAIWRMEWSPWSGPAAFITLPAGQAVEALSVTPLGGPALGSALLDVVDLASSSVVAQARATLGRPGPLPVPGLPTAVLNGATGTPLGLAVDGGATGPSGSYAFVALVGP